jgi:hypothetical protein
LLFVDSGFDWGEVFSMKIAALGTGVRHWNQGHAALVQFSQNGLADGKAIMKKKSHPNFDQTLELLRTQGFDVASCDAVAGGFLVSRYGIAAVLVPVQDALDKVDRAIYAVTPGVLVRGEISRLLDRGYQKFIKTAQYELPATAVQLHAIHQFSEELDQIIGRGDLYNESLGTTSDTYQYDRLKGREAAEPAPRRPWELSSGH